MGTFQLILLFIGLLMLLFVYVYNCLVNRRAKLYDELYKLLEVYKSKYELLEDIIKIVKNTYPENSEIYEQLVEIDKYRNNIKTIDEELKFANNSSQKITNITSSLKEKIVEDDENFIDLNNKIIDIDVKIKEFYKLFDKSVSSYNKCFELFPFSMIVKFLKFKKYNLK